MVWSSTVSKLLYEPKTIEVAQKMENWLQQGYSKRAVNNVLSFSAELLLLYLSLVMTLFLIIHIGLAPLLPAPGSDPSLIFLHFYMLDHAHIVKHIQLYIATHIHTRGESIVWKGKVEEQN